MQDKAVGGMKEVPLSDEPPTDIPFSEPAEQEEEWQLEEKEPEEVADAELVIELANQPAPMWANMGLDPKKMQAAKRFQLTQTFQVEVEELTRVSNLDSKQQKKLSIAAKGGVKKLLAKWGEKRGIDLDADGQKKSETDDEKVEITDADQIDEQTLMMMDMDANNMSPFNAEKPLENPFWKKTVAKVLTSEQLATLKTFREEQAKAKKAAQIVTMMQILNAELGLSPTQSDELQRLIKPQIDAAKPLSMALYDMFMTLYYASKVEEDALKKLLSEAQHQKWKMLMLPMKQFGQMLDQQAEAENVQADNVQAVEAEPAEQIEPPKVMDE
ncbi:hypothetical protein N9Y42_02580 [Mariniblastus sp.]|nr:hypothetical protein [Mariniblastus sp.]